MVKDTRIGWNNILSYFKSQKTRTKEQGVPWRPFAQPWVEIKMRINGGVKVGTQTEQSKETGDDRKIMQLGRDSEVKKALLG